MSWVNELNLNYIEYDYFINTKSGFAKIMHADWENEVKQFDVPLTAVSKAKFFFKQQCDSFPMLNLSFYPEKCKNRLNSMTNYESVKLIKK